MATPAGTFDAVRVWYAPAVHAAVREKREAQYTDKTFPYAVHRTQHGFMELASFARGRDSSTHP